ncbi:MAG: S-adenosylhomocysteine nucleosidase [Sulfuricurvum sp. PC08-66]|nr:MAG: S-adenosylhomocysteine nucleosidase [Sulfuricurvum sp. PC08-66]
MKIAIMAAMPEELMPILAQLGEYTQVEYAKNRYYFAKFGGHELVLAYSKIGKVFSTITATTMIEKFGAQMLLFSGVAGAISPKLSIGDLIIATQLAQHDLDITAFGHPFGYVPEGSVMIPSDAKLNAIARDVAIQKGLKLHEGIIATGDQFVANAQRKNWIADTFQADALEMEGGSVAVVCNALSIPFCILRAISDSADGSADVDFDTFLASSAQESAQFVLAMVDAIA